MKNSIADWGGGTRLWFILLLLIFFISIALITGSLPLMRNVHPDSSLNEFQMHLNKRIPSLMKLFGIPGCTIAIVRNSEIEWIEAYGYANLENGKKLTVDTPMRVQSISKSVTAWGVIRLVEQGLIDLESPVSTYLTSWNLPESEYSSDTITVRQLLSHTAGLPLGDVFTTYAPDEEMPSLEQKLTQEAILKRKPGMQFSYSNTGYNLIELLIEQVTKRDFSEYMQTEVLLPLNMKSSYFDWIETMTPIPPTGYDISGKSVPVYVYPEKASGGLFASAEDIARFAAAGMSENPVIKADSLETLYTPVSDRIGIYGLVFESYGLGHYIETVPSGLRSVSHGGQGSGIMTHFQLVPETGDAIVILTNSQRSWPFISHLLSNWARWRALPSVGMERIIWGRYGLSVVIGMLLSATLLMIRRTLICFFHKKVEMKGVEKTRLHYSRVQWIQIVTSLALIGILLWCVCQRYLFISSVFPILSVWLGGATLLFSAVMFLSAVTMPNKSKPNKL